MAGRVSVDQVGWSQSLSQAARDLHPASFAVVMSTGIVALAFHALGIAAVARPLADLNLILYAVLLSLVAVRLAVHSDAVVADLGDSPGGWGALTFVVGTNTVGVQLLVVQHAPMIAAGLWALAIASCLVLLWVLRPAPIDGLATVRQRARRVDGTVLLPTVSFQSIAILGAHLGATAGAWPVVALAVASWLVGLVLYPVTLALVCTRLLSTTVDPEEWTGPFWITMGAAAITTLAGASVVDALAAGPAWPAVTAAVRWTSGASWVVATAWLPVLLVADVWKFRRLGAVALPRWAEPFPWARLAFGRGDRHSYETLAWGRVFPMGMYAAATVALAGLAPFGLLAPIPRAWCWFALAVWALTFVGLVRATVDDVVHRSR